MDPNQEAMRIARSQRLSRFVRFFVAPEEKMNLKYAEEYERLLDLVEERLQTYLRDSPAPSLLEAMRYSLLAGGKRVRPILTLAFCLATGGREKDALDIACAVEMMHTYTLIHDDLPCMDDDELRRGKPSNHVVFGEWKAVLAGDALQSAAFAALLASDIPAERVVRCAQVFARAAGERGVCAGQTLDMEATERGSAEPNELYAIHHSKTAALLDAACVMGVIAANGTPEQERASRMYANSVGLAFQIRDDVLDGLQPTTILGKPSGSDRDKGKVTFYNVFGAQRCEEIINEQTQTAREAVGSCFKNGSFLMWFAGALAGRNM